jgi:hypothetical protein
MNTYSPTQTPTTPKPSFTPVPKGLLQRKCACGGAAGLAGKCGGCDREKLTLQRRATDRATPDEVPPIVHEVLNSSGQTLDTDTRTFMESRFDHDFSRVRVHTDDKAARSAQAVNALAYTVGKNIVFQGGEYAPGTMAGKQLLAHELAHTVQQDRVSSQVPLTLEMGQPEENAEREASEIGVSAFSQTISKTTSQTGMQLMRQQPEDPSTALPTDPITPQEMIDRAKTLRLEFLNRAGFRVRQLEIACEKQAEPGLITQAFPNEVRAFVAWIGVSPWNDSFCNMVALTKSDIEKSLNMSLPPPFFAGADDEFCQLGNQFPFANYEDTQIRICPKMVNPQLSNSTWRALILIHELFHEPSFGMSHPTLDVMNSEHCGSMGSDEAISNPYCVTNAIGQLGGGNGATM